MNTATTEILEKGTTCLVKNLGVIEAETFIAAVMRERFDYTDWQRDHFEEATLEDLNAGAIEYFKKKA